MKEAIPVAKKHIERCSTSIAIKEMQIKTTLRYYYKLIRQKGLTIPNAEKNMEQLLVGM